VLLDLVNVNLSHYRSSADREEGSHQTAIPTRVFIGLRENATGGDTVDISPRSGVILPMGGDAKILEFAGSGIAALRDDMQDKEHRMAVLGARLLTQSPAGVEAADTARIHRASESSVLASLASSWEQVLEVTLKTVAMWMQADADQVSAKLNRDYMPTGLPSGAVTEYMQAYQGGGLTLQDIFRIWKRYELVNSDTNFDEWQQTIQDDGGGITALQFNNAE